MNVKVLEIVVTTSRGRNSYGWNIVTLIDGKKRYRTCGGGYDMKGTVFANWLQENYMDRIKEKCVPVDYNKPADEQKYERLAMYGFFTQGGNFWLNGACGMNSIELIAKAIGLNIQTIYKKGCTKTIIVTENEVVS